MSTDETLSLAASSSASKRRAITWRSVLLGTMMVVGVCGLTPYNDYVVANTFLVGCFLPLFMILSFFVLVVGVNAPLYRFKPEWALNPGEMAVILTMMLVGCAIPSSGLMRYLWPQWVWPPYVGASDDALWQTFKDIDLPHWLFPFPMNDDAKHAPIVLDFFGSVSAGAPTPYGPWIIPTLGWGVFLIGWMMVLLGMAPILRPQWGTNERLPFPIAQLELSLIQAPKPGHMFNDLFGDKRFWMGAAVVFVLQGLFVLSDFFPKSIPKIPLGFNLGDVFSQPPWMYLAETVKSSVIYFTFLGVAFLLPIRISFSLWFFFLATQTIGMEQQTLGTEFVPAGAWADQHLGAAVAYMAGVLWLGRQQWVKVGRHLLFGRSAEEKRRDMPGYRGVALMVILGIAIQMTWLWVVGVHTWVAVVLVAFLMLSHLVAGRVVAETGLPFFRFSATTAQIFNQFPQSIYSGADVYFTGALHAFGPPVTRESLTAFALHGLQVSANSEPRPPRRGLIPLMVFSWVLGFVVAGASSLYCYYHYAMPITTGARLVNPDGIEQKIPMFFSDPLKNWNNGTVPRQTYSTPKWVAVGAGVAASLHFASLRWSAWPLVPVGYLTQNMWFMHRAWFSILLGWLCKVLIVRLGGYRMYLAFKPVFIGAIIGEGLSAGFWLIVNFILAWQGYPYPKVMLLPG